MKNITKTQDFVITVKRLQNISVKIQDMKEIRHKIIRNVLSVSGILLEEQDTRNIIHLLTYKIAGHVPRTGDFDSKSECVEFDSLACCQFMNSKENQQYILNKWKNLIDCTGSESPKAILVESQESWLTDRNNASKATVDGQPTKYINDR